MSSRRVLSVFAAVVSLGVGSAGQAQVCTSNPPRPVTGQMQRPYCDGGEVLSWDNSSEPEGHRTRYACLSVPSHASPEKPLPMIVYLHPSLFTPDTVYTATNLPLFLETADLSEDSERPGFVLLAPQGRDTEHFYPAPDDRGPGWDNWHRDPNDNVDVQAIDHFIDEVIGRGIVDTSRIYLTGWSNGAAMAIWYAQIRPDTVAAAGVYSPPNPYGDFDDPCPRTEFSDLPKVPILMINNDCDIAGICQTADALSRSFLAAGLPVEHWLVDSALQPADRCLELCARSPQPFPPWAGLGPDSTLGTANHSRWPHTWTPALLRFFRRHPKGG